MTVTVYGNYRCEDEAEITLDSEAEGRFNYIGHASRRRNGLENSLGEQMCDPWSLHIVGFKSVEDICRLVTLGVEAGIDMRVRGPVWAARATF